MRRVVRPGLRLRNAWTAGEAGDVKAATSSTTTTEDQEETIGAEEHLQEAIGEVITATVTVRTAGEEITETGEMGTAADISLKDPTVITATAPITKREIAKVIIRVIIKATTRATIAKETTTKATAMATTVNIQVMDKVTMTVKDLDNHITSKTTINSINSMRSSGSSIIRIRASGTSTTVNMGTTLDSRAHSEQEQRSDIIISVITHVYTTCHASLIKTRPSTSFNFLFHTIYTFISKTVISQRLFGTK